MAFSDFPCTVRFPRHPWRYLQYLKDYASNYGLTKYVHFQTEVVCVERKGMVWLVTTRSSESGVTVAGIYDAVAVCSGTHQLRKMPSLPGMQRFSGTVLHSSQYKNNDDFAGKRVCIVGIGESSADIAREISDVALESHLCLRGYLNPSIVGGHFNASKIRFVYQRADGTPRPHPVCAFECAIADAECGFCALLPSLRQCERTRYGKAVPHRVDRRRLPVRLGTC